MAASKNRICSHSECDNKHDSHGYCANHARQFRKYGHPLTKDEIYAMRSAARKGRATNLGKTWKIADTSNMKGRHPKSEFKKGSTPWNKGTKGVMKAWNKGTKGLATAWNKGFYGLNSGENNPNWKGGTSEAYRLRRTSQYKEWRTAVFARDSYTCQSCNAEGGYLTAHHVKSVARYPEMVYEIDNGLTLCEPCHSETDNYKGRGKLKGAIA